MFQTLRRRGFAVTILAAFLLAQPAALCAALCLVEQHHPAGHAMPGTGRGAAVTASTCHTAAAGAVQRDRYSVLSPMAPSRSLTIAAELTGQVEPAPAVSAVPPQRFHPTESPPPRRL
jgi:hypothetical protein